MGVIKFFSNDVVYVDKLSLEYPRLIEHVLKHGETVPSRIGATKEILDLRLGIAQPEYCIVGRKGFSRKFMDEEIVQLLAGVHDNARLAACSPTAAQLITPATAYGPRTWEQLEYVANELAESPSSRRAVVYIGRATDLWGAKELGAVTAGEMPCTMTWQFHLRDGWLNMAVSMRSWDLVWGLSYDVPSFVAVQMMLADHLGAALGSYVHNAGSAHVYERHWDLETWETDERLVLPLYAGGPIAETREQARKIVEWQPT